MLVTVVGWFGLIVAAWAGVITLIQAVVFTWLTLEPVQPQLYTPAEPCTSDGNGSGYWLTYLFVAIPNAAVFLIALSSGGLLRGWRWARWSMTVVLAFAAVLSVAWALVFAFTTAEMAEPSTGVRMFQIGIIVFGIAVAVMLGWVGVKLHGRAVRDWFRS